MGSSGSIGEGSTRGLGTTTCSPAHKESYPSSSASAAIRAASRGSAQACEFTPKSPTVGIETHDVTRLAPARPRGRPRLSGRPPQAAVTAASGCPSAISRRRSTCQAMLAARPSESPTTALNPRMRAAFSVSGIRQRTS